VRIPQTPKIQRMALNLSVSKRCSSPAFNFSQCADNRVAALAISATLMHQCRLRFLSIHYRVLATSAFSTSSRGIPLSTRSFALSLEYNSRPVYISALSLCSNENVTLESILTKRSLISDAQKFMMFAAAWTPLRYLKPTVSRWYIHLKSKTHALSNGGTAQQRMAGERNTGRCTIAGGSVQGKGARDDDKGHFVTNGRFSKCVWFTGGLWVCTAETLVVGARRCDTKRGRNAR
jgi:hypothetical protein